MYPLVALIGRPNVGKSSLFNRLTHSHRAIVTNDYGTTRDALMQTIVLGRKKIDLVDTAGIISKYQQRDEIDKNVQEQALDYLQHADLVLFLIDGQVALNEDDYALAKRLRQTDRPLILVVNKCDNEQISMSQNEFYRLGFDEVAMISTTHNLGVAALTEMIVKVLKRNKSFPARQSSRLEKVDLTLALVGRPNVGKSTLFNRLINSKKAVVSDIAGTTRDTIDTVIEYADTKIKIIDTAGLRRPGKREVGVEKFSVLRTMRAIHNSDICLFLLDAPEKVSHMDQAISRYILDERKGLILVTNKWDMMQGDEKLVSKYRTYLQDRFEYLPWAPVLFISAQTGLHTEKILDQVLEVAKSRAQRIETGQLNRFFTQVAMRHPPSGTKKIVPKIYYSSQVETNPPHFLLFVNEKEAFHFSWVRYLERSIREQYGFIGTPIILELRNRTRRDLRAKSAENVRKTRKKE